MKKKGLIDLDFIRHHDFPFLRALIPEYFFKDWCVAGIVDFVIDGISDVIEKGFEAGVAVAFGGLFGSFSESG